MASPADTFLIEVNYEDEHLREQVIEGSNDPRGWITELEADETMYVGEEDSSGMREYLTTFFGGLVQSVESCLQGESSHFTAPSGPVYVYVEPVKVDRIRFGFAYKLESIESTSAREAFEPSAVVLAEPLVSEVLRAAKNFHNHVGRWNPDLVETSVDYQGLLEDIEDLEGEFLDFTDR